MGILRIVLAHHETNVWKEIVHCLRRSPCNKCYHKCTISAIDAKELEALVHANVQLSKHMTNAIKQQCNTAAESKSLLVKTQQAQSLRVTIVIFRE